MKTKITILCMFLFFASCSNINKKQESLQDQLNGTWLLISAVTKEGDNVTKKDLTGQKMIKLINESHFAFLSHDLNHGQDSTADFVAGGGRCFYENNIYKESLEYCNYRDWEGLEVEFSISIKNDTLTITGIEKIEELEVYQEITETYVRIVE